MKPKQIALIAISSIILSGFAACTSTYQKESGRESTDGSVSSIPLDFSIKNAKKCFEISNTDDTMSYTLAIEATVLWPEKIGEYDIRPLQDTIKYLVAGKKTETINDAITTYVSDAAVYEIGDKITEVDSVPTVSPFNTAFYAETDVTVSDISSGLITISCVTDQYLGGAHNMTGSVILTYDLRSATFISNKWLFKNPESPELLDAIKNAIAEETNMSVAELEQTKIVPAVPVPDDVYLQNGMIVFHYNPYAVLPYSFGAIDAQVSPYLIKDMLTPEAHAMLISE